MANPSRHVTMTPTTELDLIELGFSSPEIRSLRDLRDSWNPAVEQTDSRQAWRRIQFARWLYERGHFSEDDRS